MNEVVEVKQININQSSIFKGMSMLSNKLLSNCSSKIKHFQH